MIITIPIAPWFIYGWLAIGFMFTIGMLVWAYVADTYGPSHWARFKQLVTNTRWWLTPFLGLGGPIVMAVAGVMTIHQTITRRRLRRRWAAEDAEQKRLKELEEAESR